MIIGSSPQSQTIQRDRDITVELRTVKRKKLQEYVCSSRAFFSGHVE